VSPTGGLTAAPSPPQKQNSEHTTRQKEVDSTARKGEKRKRKARGGPKTWEEKTEDRASLNRKTAKKQGKKNVLKKKQLRLIQPEKSHSNRNAAFRAYFLWAW
jgi:hypothetical protein